jgi:hypothetical protein
MDSEFVMDIGVAMFALYIVYKITNNHLRSIEQKLEELKNEVRLLRAVIEKLVLG